MTTRRNVLKALALSGPALALPLQNALGNMHRSGGGGSGGGGGGLAFQRPLPIANELNPTTVNGTDFYEITQQEADVEIIPGTTTRIWGYNGTWPGPTIRATAGRPVTVRQINNLPSNTSTHLHGGHVAPEDDGHPNDLVAPGTSKDYVYSNNQLPATLWYHDHAHRVTAEHVYFGLSAFYILEDNFERGLNLPSGAYEVAMAIQDRSFNADGSFNYSGDVNGEFGDTQLVNGAIQPFFEVGTRKYRFRILNGSNARPYELALDNGQPFIQIGSDGGLLDGPIERSSIFIAPAERVDVVIDFTNVAVGTQIVLQNLLESGDMGQVMRFDVTRVEADDSEVPATLRPIAYIDEAEAVTTRSWALSRTMSRSDPWVINGQLYDPDRVDAFPQLNTVEIWEFTNRSNMDHPMHIHDVMFQVLSVNGSMMGGSGGSNPGWKDTVNVPPMGTARVIMRFEDYTGRYVFHCHNVEHEDHEMMGQFEVVR